MVNFPVSGVEVNPLLPLLVAFAVSALTAPAGISGAFLLLPFQVSVLGFDSPAISPTWEGSVAGRSTVRVLDSSPLRVEYEYGGKSYAFFRPAVFALSLGVGVIGGIYSIGGGSIIAPFLVTAFGLPVYTIAGATLTGTFVTSVAGVAFYELLAATGIGGGAPVAPDWSLGLTLGIGGLVGTYAGARLQGYVPERLIRGVLGTLVTLLAIRYILWPTKF
jgi:uncharacterized membrane protein YfcA